MFANPTMTFPLPTAQIPAPQAAPDPDADDFGRFCRSGDRAALLAVWQRSEPILAAICRRHCPLEADDALQDAALQVLAHAGSWAGRGTVRSWLVAVAANAARQRQRAWLRRQARQQCEAPLPVCVDPDPTVAETAAAVATALAGLPDTYRLPLIWRYLDGLEFRDIASACGINEKACRRRVELGLQRLRRALQTRPAPGAAALMPALAVLGQGQSATSAQGGFSTAAATITTAPLPATVATTSVVVGWPLAAGLAVAGASLLTLALRLTEPPSPLPPTAAVASEPTPAPPAPVADATLDALLARQAVAEFRQDTLDEAVAWFRPTRREAGLIVDLAQNFATTFITLPRANRTVRDVLTARCENGSAAWVIRGGRIVVHTPLTPVAVQTAIAGLDQAQGGSPPAATLAVLGSLDLWRTILRDAPATPPALLTARLRWLPTALSGAVWREDPTTVAALAGALARIDLAAEARIQLLSQAAGAGAAARVLETVITTALQAKPATVDQPLPTAFSPARLAAVAVCRALGDPLVADGGLIARSWRTIDRHHGLARHLLQAAIRRGVVSSADALKLAQDPNTPYTLRITAADAVARWGVVDANSAPAWLRMAQDPEASPAFALCCHGAWVMTAERDVETLLQWPKSSYWNLRDWRAIYLDSLISGLNRPVSLSSLANAMTDAQRWQPYALADSLAAWVDVPPELPADLPLGVAAVLRTPASDALVLRVSEPLEGKALIATGALRLTTGTDRVLAVKKPSQGATYAMGLSRDPRCFTQLIATLAGPDTKTKNWIYGSIWPDTSVWQVATKDDQDNATRAWGFMNGLRSRAVSSTDKPTLAPGFVHAAVTFCSNHVTTDSWLGYDSGVALTAAPPSVANEAAAVWLQMLTRQERESGGIAWLGVGIPTPVLDGEVLAFAERTARTHADARMRVQAGLVAIYFGPGGANGRQLREDLAKDTYPPIRRLFTPTANGPQWNQTALEDARWLWLAAKPLELPAHTAPTPLRTTQVFWGKQRARITISEPTADGRQLAQVVIPRQPQDVTYTAIAGVTATGATLIDARGGTCSPGWIPESFIIAADGSVRLSDEDGPWHDGTTTPPQPAAKEPIAPTAGGF